jgi:hypothetical protein
MQQPRASMRRLLLWALICFGAYLAGKTVIGVAVLVQGQVHPRRLAIWTLTHSLGTNILAPLQGWPSQHLSSNLLLESQPNFIFVWDHVYMFWMFETL